MPSRPDAAGPAAIADERAAAAKVTLVSFLNALTPITPHRPPDYTGPPQRVRSSIEPFLSGHGLQRWMGRRKRWVVQPLTAVVGNSGSRIRIRLDWAISIGPVLSRDIGLLVRDTMLQVAVPHPSASRPVGWLAAAVGPRRWTSAARPRWWTSTAGPRWWTSTAGPRGRAPAAAATFILPRICHRRQTPSRRPAQRQREGGLLEYLHRVLPHRCRKVSG